jgi:hypothetical protein
MDKLKQDIKQIIQDATTESCTYSPCKGAGDCEDCAYERIVKTIQDYAVRLVAGMPLVESRYLNQQRSDMKYISEAFELDERRGEDDYTQRSSRRLE